ncbi:MAG TPA: phosphatase PAP2 family protein [Longimicrobiales bacterium]
MKKSASVRHRVSAGLGTLRGALDRELRFIARHVRGFYSAVLAALALAFAFSLAAALLFAALSHLVMQGTTQLFDIWVLRSAAALRTPMLDDIMLEITSLGNGAVLATMVVIVSVFLWLTHHRYSVFFLLFAVLGGLVLNSALKDLFDRPRPSVVEWATMVGSTSFPSGHAMSAMIAYGSVAYLVGRLEPTPTLRRATWILAAVLILLIGISRIYLGVHYPSDVLAGYVAGLAWTSFVISGIHTIRFFAARKPEVEQAERGLHAEEERTLGLRE